MGKVMGTFVIWEWATGSKMTFWICQLSQWESSAFYWDVRQRQGQQHPNIISMQSPHAFTSSQQKSFVKAASHLKIPKLLQQPGPPFLPWKEPVAGWHRSSPTPSTVPSLSPTTTASVFQVREKKINLSQPGHELRVLMIKEAKFEPLLQASLKHLLLKTALTAISPLSPGLNPKGPANHKAGWSPRSYRFLFQLFFLFHFAFYSEGFFSSVCGGGNSFGMCEQGSAITCMHSTQILGSFQEVYVQVNQRVGPTFAWFYILNVSGMCVG